MTDISDFKLECAKMFLMKLSQHDSNFGQNFLAVLEYAFRQSDKNTLGSTHCVKRVRIPSFFWSLFSRI